MAYFKIAGWRLINLSDPSPADTFVSDIARAQTGDILIDESGNPILFGTMGIPYATEPPNGTFTPGETKLWYNVYTNTVWSKTQKLDLTFVKVDMGISGTLGVMYKSVYDSNNDGIVNAADMLKAGTKVVTAFTAWTHIYNSPLIHAPLSDAVVNPGYIWSSLKINNELETKSPIDHVHPEYNGVDYPDESVPSRGFVPYPYEGLNELHVLHTDGSWGMLKQWLDQQLDVSVVYPEDGNLLVRYADYWMNVQIVTDDFLEVVFDPEARTLLFSYKGKQYHGHEIIDDPIESLTLVIDRRHSLLQNLLADDHPQYYNAGRLADWWATLTTDDLTEGSSNLYWLDARWDAKFVAASIAGLSDVDVVFPESADLFMYLGSAWGDVKLQTSGGMSAVFDAYNRTLTLISSGVVDSLEDIYDRRHSLLQDLGADDHGQYYNAVRLNSWWNALSFGLSKLSDVDLQLPEEADLFMYLGSAWGDVKLQTAGSLSAVFNAYTRTLTLTASGGGSVDSLTEIYDRRHSLLQDLGADDHVQYYNTSRLNAWWASRSLYELADVTDDTQPVEGHALMGNGTFWTDVELLGVNINIVFDPVYRTLTLEGNQEFSIPEGVAFPGYPAVPQLFFRTDLETLFLWSQITQAWIDVSNAPSSSSVSITTQTSEYTATAGDTAILCDGSFTVHLPPVAEVTGKLYYIKNISYNETIVVDPYGSETIDGNASVPLADGESLTIVTDGSNWFSL